MSYAEIFNRSLGGTVDVEGIRSHFTDSLWRLARPGLSAAITTTRLGRHSKMGTRSTKR
jgi:hypothetical protein